MGVGKSFASSGRRRGGSAREGAGASQQPQVPVEDEYCPVIGSKINMDAISDEEVARAYSFIISFDEVLTSIKLEERGLLIHIAELYELKWSLEEKITSLKVSIKSSPSTDMLKRIKVSKKKKP